MKLTGGLNMKGKLTADTIDKFQLPPGKDEDYVHDTEIPGFRLRMRKGGSRNLEYAYKFGTKNRRVPLGAGVPEAFKTIKDKKTGEVLKVGARDRAADLQARVRLGEDPAGERIDSKKAETFLPVAKRYLAEREKGVRKDGADAMRPASYAELERHILKHCQPLHGLKIASIGQHTVVELLDNIRDTSGPIASDRVRSSGNALYGWASNKAIVPLGYNPFAATAKNGSKPRERVLSDGELAEIWRAAGDDHYGSIIKLLMLSGQRAGEVAGLLRSEIVKTEVPKARRDGVELPAFMVDALDLPEERMKAKKRHVTPLSKPALDIIERQPKRVGNDGKIRDLLFGVGDGPFSGWSRCKERLDHRIYNARLEAWGENGGQGEKPEPMKPWTPHDLRRTLDTKMNETLAIAPHVVAAVLAHTSSQASGKAGSERHYNHAQYLREKVDALRQWGDFIMALVGENVVPLRQVAP